VTIFPGVHLKVPWGNLPVYGADSGLYYFKGGLEKDRKARIVEQPYFPLILARSGVLCAWAEVAIDLRLSGV